MKRQIIIVGMLAALGPFAAPGMAQTNSTRPNSNNTVSAADRSFAENAAQVGIAEVKMGELAVDNGGSPQVRAFGEHLLEDYSGANGELAYYAAQENIKLPTDMSRSDQATYNQLSKLKGAAFDLAYARYMVNAHEKDIADFQKEAKDGKSESIKNFAVTTMPTLQEYLTAARDMQNNVSQSGEKMTKPDKPS